MTSTPLPGRRCHRIQPPSSSFGRAGLPLQCGRSHDDRPVSQDRHGWPQIESLVTETALCRAMISAMHELPKHLLNDWSPDSIRYTSAYPSSYTIVYTIWKVVK